MLAFDAQITFLSTADLEATARFYEDVVGLELALDQGSCRIYRVVGQAFLGFCQREQTSPSPDVIVTLVLDDVDGAVARLVQGGAELVQGPAVNERYQIYQAFLRDVNGYTLEIQRFIDPRWPGPRST